MERGAANFSVSSAFTDNCVLQRDETIHVWGTSSDEGAFVYATLGDSVAKGIVENGEWCVEFAPRTYSDRKETIHLYGSDAARHVYIENVLIGDVWIVAGQSNVEYTLLSASNCDRVSERAENSANIRIRRCGSAAELEESAQQSPQKELPTNCEAWKCLSRYNIQPFSALGGQFAIELNEALHGEIPIGIISLGFSGKGIASFLPKSIAHGKLQKKEQSTIYNTYIYPLSKLKIKGFVWYQGETDEISNSIYADAFCRFATVLREEKAQNFPIYMIELPPCFDDAEDANRQFMNFGNVRAVQGSIPMELPNAYICSTSDLWKDRGYSNNLHPDNKDIIAKRLSLMVLSKEYGFGEEESYFAPTVVNVEYSDDGTEAELKYNYVGEGLSAYGETLRGFEAVGADWDPLEIECRISDKDTVVISAKERICIIKYNAVADGVFGENITLQNSYGKSAIAFSKVLYNPQKGIGNIFRKFFR